ncbi:hypothetical protein MMC24_006654 [Lignoscripta atroalba]|nr:hypothetical protein [Lignoscripta atroalba]
MALPTKKRKALTDFFSPVAKTPKAASQDTTPLSTPVPGLTLYKEFVTTEEEKRILSFLNSEQCTWRTDLSRRTMHFGGEYCLMPPRQETPTDETPPTQASQTPKPKAKPAMIQAPAMPSEFDFLLHRMLDLGIYDPVSRQKPQYCIINHYTSNLGISAHTENFSFAQPVVGLSLLCPCPMRFHELVERHDGSVRSGKATQAKRTGRWVDVMLPGRSLLVMNGDARWRWQHEILRSGRGRWEGWERVSLTFRVKV